MHLQSEYFLAKGLLYVCATCLAHVLDTNTVLFLVRGKKKKPKATKKPSSPVFSVKIYKSFIVVFHPTCYTRSSIFRK